MNSVLKEQFGFTKFRDRQKDIIKAVVDGKDVCAIMFTGAGKSLCYQFPAVFTKKTALVVSPLISLMDDQCIKLKDIGVTATTLNSNVNKQKIIPEILDGKYRLVYTTPEFIVSSKQFLIDMYELELLVVVAIDEAHCVSSWGHDFRASYREIKCIKEWIPKCPILAMTATATPLVKQDIIDILGLNEPLVVQTTFDRPNLFIKISKKSKGVEDDLFPIIRKCKGSSIVYCQTRKNVEYVTEILKMKGVNCEAYHAGLCSMERELVHESFISGDTDCVVATVAFGMGIDRTVRTVVHYGVPKDLESYYQEIGRAGRDGKSSNCYMLYSRNDMEATNYHLKCIEDPVLRRYKFSLATVMKKFVYSTECRRKYILRYFGEEYSSENCGKCDMCSTKSVKLDLGKEASILLKTVHLSGDRYGVSMVVSVIRGSKAQKVHDKLRKLSTYGKGKNRTAEWWKLFSKMLINIGYLVEKQNDGSYGVSLSTTKAGRLWLQEGGEKLKIDIPSDMGL